MSPELVNPRPDSDDSRPTTKSDCYSLGMVILEVLSGRPPFTNLNDSVIAQKVIAGECPESPDGAWYTEDLWRTLKCCWSRWPKNRPEAIVVLNCLKRASVCRTLSPPGAKDATKLSGPSMTNQSLSAGPGRDVRLGTEKQSPHKESGPGMMPHTSFTTYFQLPLGTSQNATPPTPITATPEEVSAIISKTVCSSETFEDTKVPKVEKTSHVQKSSKFMSSIKKLLK